MESLVHDVCNGFHLTVVVKSAVCIGVGICVYHAHAAGLRKIIRRECAELLFGHTCPQEQRTDRIGYRKLGGRGCAVGDNDILVDICQVGISQDIVRRTG